MTNRPEPGAMPDPTAEQRETARKIAAILGETKTVPRQQLVVIVQNHPLDLIKDWLRDAKRIHDEGGMYTANRTRKRTFGGVFFQLVKQHERDQAETTNPRQP